MMWLAVVVMCIELNNTTKCASGVVAALSATEQECKEQAVIEAQAGIAIVARNNGVLKWVKLECYDIQKGMKA
jgi:hypothetical protein